MAAGALTVLAAAVALWPPTGAARRLPRRTAKRLSFSRLRPGRVVAIPGAAAIGWLAAGLGGLLAAVLAIVLGQRVVVAHRKRRASGDQLASLAAALRVVVAELRAGGHPAAAADGAAEDAAPEIADVLRKMAATVRLGGSVADAARDTSGPLARAWARVARAWALAERHGLALADLLDSVRRDLDHRTAVHRDVESRMAGPRATAGVLAVLPVLGIALGEASGAGAVAVLREHVLGQVLLVAGVALLGAGLLWTARITGTAVRG
ncbi:secretion system protein [Allosaccharopolyspora coralli]|uniref:Secretion system protein n=2 Tax=Allosaccharopolyspora coralli TaxID=2665642 RepID=A0A5Q3QFF5_9PSEU|nr:secretion system protein [Allosaccharopolyspora coralli]